MDADNLELAAGLVSAGYVAQGGAALGRRRRLIKTLLSQRRLPAEGWDEATIEALLADAAAMDSNTFLGGVGVGEREGRVACPLVARRHFGLAHGVGRSGDLAAEQPKAAGSSLLARLAALLAADALAEAGLAGVGRALVLPAATGMTLALALAAAAAAAAPGARTVLWPRIDQKTCAKCVAAAGLALVPVPLRRAGDELVTDVPALRAALAAAGGAAGVAAVLTTASCFAPRAPDDVEAVARLCAEAGVAHIINCAYGVQSAATCAAVSRAWRVGRVDAVVASTDKNFMVPVGGALLCAPAELGAAAAGAAGSRHASWLVDAVAAAYPGRGSAAPAVDLLATLLHWGRPGWAAARAAREDAHPYFRERLAEFAAARGERLLDTPANPISLAMTLQTLGGGEGGGGRGGGATELGAMLFARLVSGARVVARGGRARVCGVEFPGYGAHCDDAPCDYLAAAAALGTRRADVDEFLRRLGRCWDELLARRRRAGGAEGLAQALEAAAL